MLRAILRYTYKKILPKHMREYVDVFNTLRLSTHDDFTQRRVLVLSPHPDDDILGCAGLLHMYHLRGAQIMSVYMTDGRRGSTTIQEDKLVCIRQQEARQAASIVGIKNVLFLNNKDGELAFNSANVARLTEILKTFKPEAIFLPFFMDSHNDHRLTNRIFLSAVNTLPAMLCYTFGIWNPLTVFNCSVDITPYIEIKKEAVRAHISQMENIDLCEVFLGLNKYYAAISGRGGWAEVFIVCTSKEYKRLTEVAIW